MLAPSPFRASHRRSRSHSLSSPSTSPVLPKSDSASSRAACYPFSRQSPGALPVASILTSQPPEKWDVEAWRRGKRARRDDPVALVEDTDMDFADEPMSSSPILDFPLPLHNSAPSTPRLPSSSEAFHFFPTKPMATAVAALPSASTHTATSQPTSLGQMQSDAFGDLRSAVSEAGEGFVRRMREFEASRSIRGLRMAPSSPSSSSLSHPDGPADRRSPPMRTRGRKRPSPSSVRCPTTSGHPYRRGTEDDGDDESDVDIRSSCAPIADDVPSWSPSKKRAVSLSALSPKAGSSAASLPYPIPLRSRDRSSSPLGSAYSGSSSDDEEDEGEGLSRRFRNRPNSRIQPRRASRFVASSATSHAIQSSPFFPKDSTSPPPLSFSFSNSNSNNSSRISLPIGSSPISAGSKLDLYTQDGLDCETPGRTMHRPVVGSGNKLSKKTERAVEALSLALANGAGSVSDYEALRDAKEMFSFDHSETGSMWD